MTVKETPDKIVIEIPEAIEFFTDKEIEKLIRNRFEVLLMCYMRNLRDPNSGWEKLE
jgi:hypothetical protein